MQKNITKRNEILNCTYQLISESGYKKVFLRDIAEKANIKKSLLQHYFAKKSDIIESILREMLALSFAYVENKASIDEDIYLQLSVYTSLFFEAVSKHERWDNFILNIISEKELLDIWIDIVYEWMYELGENSEIAFSDGIIKTALAFSIAGGMELYLYRNKLHIEVTFICEQITASFMRILGKREAEIQKILNNTEQRLKKIDLADFDAYCNEHIEWFCI